MMQHAGHHDPVKAVRDRFHVIDICDLVSNRSLNAFSRFNLGVVSFGDVECALSNIQSKDIRAMTCHFKGLTASPTA